VVVIELWVVAEPERLEYCELKPNQPILMVVPVQTGSDGMRVILELPFPEGVRVVLELPFPDGVLLPFFSTRFFRHIFVRRIFMRKK